MNSSSYPHRRWLVMVMLILLCVIQTAISAKGIPGSYRTSSRDRSKTRVPLNNNVRDMQAPVMEATFEKDENLYEGNIELEGVHLSESPPTLVPTRMPTPAKPSLPPNYELHPPPCINNETEIAYVNGMISPTMTFYNCLANLGDPWSIPTFYNGTINGVMIVYNSIQLNNLHEIDAVMGTAALDFYFRLYWRDNRLAMPLLWEKLPKAIRSTGIELTLILTNDSNPFWRPDIRFHDAVDLDYIVETIRINSTNDIFWSRHTVGTFMQPKFKFDDYPSDNQTIHIRFGSYAYSQSFLKNAFNEPGALTLNQNYDGTKTFESNPIWTFDNSTTTYNLYLSSSGFLNAIYNISVKRQGNGIVIRLILPIALLIILGGLTFWAQYEGRVDSTITLLLSVSALYIVILSNIPLLGYLTAIDKYVFWMFLLLVFSVVLHQFYATLNEKSDQWPLRKFAVRIIECIGRTTVFPIAGYFFVSGIKRLSNMLVIGMFFVVIPISMFIGIRELWGVYNTWEHSFDLLLQKINNPETKIAELSKFELFVVNRRMFNLWSTKPDRIAAEIATRGELVNKIRNKIELNKLFAINRLIGKSTGATVQGSAAVSSDRVQEDKSIPMVNIVKKIAAEQSAADAQRSYSISSSSNPMQAAQEYDMAARDSNVSTMSTMSGVGGRQQFVKASAKSVNDNFAQNKSIMSHDDSDDES